MKILALDCSTDMCSVALLQQQGDESVVQQKLENAARQHTQRLLPLVDELLLEANVSLAQLDAIAFGRGPGSFTGLRICLGAVQGLAFGADLPVLAVSTLEAQAQTWLDSLPSSLSKKDQLSTAPYILSSLDARMDEVYWALYQTTEDGLHLIGDERLTAPEQLLAGHDIQRRDVNGLGSASHYASQIKHFESYACWDTTVQPTAAAVARLGLRDFHLGKQCSADQALPVYLRDEVAWQKQKV